MLYYNLIFYKKNKIKTMQKGTSKPLIINNYKCIYNKDIYDL